MKKAKVYKVVIMEDCKTSSTKIFRFTRLEDNQIMAMELWFAKGNKYAFVYIKYNESIYEIPYKMLKGLGKVNLEECDNFRVR